MTMRPRTYRPLTFFLVSYVPCVKRRMNDVPLNGVIRCLEQPIGHIVDLPVRKDKD
jgi:hypothetical protein